MNIDILTGEDAEKCVKALENWLSSFLEYKYTSSEGYTGCIDGELVSVTIAANMARRLLIAAKSNSLGGCLLCKN
jgi:hypothetical protein